MPTWGEISRTFHEAMGSELFAPAFHSYTEGIFKDRTLTLKERYTAWILRTTWGNSSEFCCLRIPPTLEPKPMLQADAARVLGVSPKSISLVTRDLVKQGRIRVDSEGHIILNKIRGENITIKQPLDESPYQELWRTYFPLIARETDEARARIVKDREIVQKGRVHYLRYLKQVTRSGNESSAPVTGGVFGSGNTSTQGSGNDLSPAPVTPAVSPNIGTRPTLNLKQETSLVSEWIERLAAADRAHSLTEIKQTIEQDYGTALQENDPIPGQLLAKAAELTMPTGALCRWIGEFTKKKRAANYEITSPNLYVKAAEKELEPWARRNADLVYRFQYQRDVQARERQSAFEALRNPDAPDDEKQWARKVLGVAAETKGAL